MHQPRDEEHDEEKEQAEIVPSFLTAKELQARDPGKPPRNDEEAQEPARKKPR